MTLFRYPCFPAAPLTLTFTTILAAVGCTGSISFLILGFASMLFNLLSNIIRALGDSKTPLLFLVIAQLISGLLCLIYIRRKIPMLHLSKEDWHVSGWKMDSSPGNRELSIFICIIIPMPTSYTGTSVQSYYFHLFHPR